MNFKTTWFLLTVAVLLAGFIYGWEKFMAAPARVPLMVVPGLDPDTIQRVQVRVAGQPEVLAERTNGVWHLTKPLPCAARPQMVQLLLQNLANLKPQSYLSPRELMSRPNAEAEFGFETPQISIMLFSETGRQQLLIGSHTAPGDQIFVELVGTPGIHLVATNVLAAIPQQPGDWRDTALMDWKSLAFDRLQINQGSRIMELVQNPTNKLWRLARLQARADGPLVEELLENLRAVQIQEFVTDEAGAELADYGLDAPDLEMIFSQGSNIMATLQFGASNTNGTNVVYGRVGGTDSVFAVSADDLKPWRAPAADFRDRRLFSLRYVPTSIEVRGADQFTLQRESTNLLWRVTPGDFIADTNYMNEILVTMAKMEIVEFVKDVVTQPDLAGYGLDPAAVEFTLNFDVPGEPRIHVLFGTNRDDVVYAKRADEPSVSAVRSADASYFPTVSWAMRNRRIWLFSANEVARVTIEQNGQKRELLHTGSNTWSLVEGSVGMINPFAVEETVDRLGDLSAAAWVAHGKMDQSGYGFAASPNKLTLTLRNGTVHKVEFGGIAPSQYPYARVTLQGEPWVFEFPWATAQFINDYLSIPNP